MTWLEAAAGLHQHGSSSGWLLLFSIIGAATVVCLAWSLVRGQAILALVSGFVHHEFDGGSMQWEGQCGPMGGRVGDGTVQADVVIVLPMSHDGGTLDVDGDGGGDGGAPAAGKEHTRTAKLTLTAAACTTPNEHNCDELKTVCR